MSALLSGELDFPWVAGGLILRDSERCECSPVADFQLLINVMEMHLDGTVVSRRLISLFDKPSDTKHMTPKARSAPQQRDE